MGLDNETKDNVEHPSHYTSGPKCPHCGQTVECITITREMDFDIGNAMKYMWRAGKKDKAKEIEDLEKAIWYLRDKIKTLRGE